MVILTYNPLSDNGQSLIKNALDLPAFQISWESAVPGGVTLAACSCTAINSLGTDASASVISGVATSGTVTTISLLTAGTSGSQSAIHGARFRVRTIQTLSNSRQLQMDNYIYVNAEGYSPDA